MKCPFCGQPDTQVAETRTADDDSSIRRRRRCAECERRFTTYEHAELALPMVVKRDGRRTEFDRKKLQSSLYIALRKRPVGVQQIERAIDDIETRLRGSGEREIAAQRLGEWVMAELQRLDKVAYVRFASVYRNFEDVDDFRDAVDALHKKNR
jgi:transcriptional repressor NrdR